MVLEADVCGYTDQVLIQLFWGVICHLDAATPVKSPNE